MVPCLIEWLENLFLYLSFYHILQGYNDVQIFWDIGCLSGLVKRLSRDIYDETRSFFQYTRGKTVQGHF